MIGDNYDTRHQHRFWTEIYYLGTYRESLNIIYNDIPNINAYGQCLAIRSVVYTIYNIKVWAWTTMIQT